MGTINILKYGTKKQSNFIVISSLVMEWEYSPGTYKEASYRGGFKYTNFVVMEVNEEADAIAHVVVNQGVVFEINEDKTTDAIAGAAEKVKDYTEVIENVISQAKK